MQILANFGLDNSAAPASATSPAAKPAPVADLLDVSEPDLLGADSSPFPTEPPTLVPEPENPTPSADLLGDDLWSAPQTSAPPAEQQTSGGDLFSGLTVGSGDAAQKPAGGDSSELFAGMNLESGGPGAPTSAPPASDDPFGLSAPVANGAGADPLSDLMGGLSVAPPQTAAPLSPGGVKSPQGAAPQVKQPLPPMPMPGVESAQWQQPQGVPGMMSMQPQQMTPQQMQQMQMAYLHQMQQRGMGMPGMMPFPGPQPGFGQGLGAMPAGFGGLAPQQQPGFAHGVSQNGAHFGWGFGGGLQPSGGSLGGGAFASLGAGGSGDLFQNAGIAHSQENKAETKAFDFIAVSIWTSETEL